MKSASQIVKGYLKSEGITNKHLAELLNETPSNLSHKLSKADLDTSFLMRASVALKKNLITLIGEQWDNEISNQAFEKEMEKPSKALTQDENQKFIMEQFEKQIRFLTDKIERDNQANKKEMRQVLAEMKTEQTQALQYMQEETVQYKAKSSKS